VVTSAWKYWNEDRGFMEAESKTAGNKRLLTCPGILGDMNSTYTDEIYNWIQTLCHINSSCSYAGYKPTQTKILNTSETFSEPYYQNSYIQFLIFPSMSEIWISDWSEHQSKKLYIYDESINHLTCTLHHRLLYIINAWLVY
jgi:hypothetical protein